MRYNSLRGTHKDMLMSTTYHDLPAIDEEFIRRQDYFLLFESSRFDKDNFTSHIFTDPVNVITVYRFEEIERAFAEIEACAQSYYLAGYFSYELGYFFEKNSFRYEPTPAHPLIRLGVFDRKTSFDHKTGRFSGSGRGFAEKKKPENGFSIKHLRFNFTKARYTDKIRRIKEYIRQGQTYQVNLTGKYHFDFSG